ncbi:MAG: hypothetical protein AAF693_22775, partial [Bacteroidota bacterium]
MRQFSVALFSILILFLLLDARAKDIDESDCPVEFVEKNGMVVLEMESLSTIPSGWTLTQKKNYYSGDGYLVWEGG